MKTTLSLFVLSLVMSVGCAAPAGEPEAAAEAQETAAPRVVQFFKGMVQPSSPDGAIAFGPPYPSLVRRVADPAHDRVLEEVTEAGNTFVTIMKRKEGLVFTAQDTGSTFHGTLTYGDASLSSWSYDIDVTGDHPGHIGGALPDRGGSYDAKTGKLTIAKTFGDSVLLTEHYDPITEAEYEAALAAVVP